MSAAPDQSPEAEGLDIHTTAGKLADLDRRLDEAVHDLWAGRTDRYSEIRSSLTAGLNKVEMSHIGG